MRPTLLLAILWWLVSPLISLQAQTDPPPFLPVTQAADGAFPMVSNWRAAPIFHDPSEPAVVGVAAQCLADDVERVTGSAPTVLDSMGVLPENVVFVGTLGHSAFIDDLAQRGKIDVSAIRGKWECYLATVVKDPSPGVKQGLVIVGSDRRGTAFGIFGLSEAIGVNPWYWWADVAPSRQTSLYVGAGTYVEPSPGVKYRGIFLNDEDWGLQPWAAKTFEPETGDIGPKTYARVFELLLRLHANFCWPAMHDCTKPFNTFPQNKVVADQYAIVMGSSHHEPMLRDTSEYDAKKLGPYNYWTNRENIRRFWDERVRENATYENIYTIGMRGNTDDGIMAPKGTTLQGKVEELQKFIIPDQRQMLRENVAADPATVPQIFVPYKEALLQYQAGLQVPDDVTLVWPDDNHGYIRELSTTAEQKRSGGSGVYYHLSYWGAPKDYLWLCTTPPAVTWEEMNKAYAYDARRLWIVNIGDIKPGEIGMDFFLRLARHPEAFHGFDQRKYLTDWAARTFGSAQAEKIADVLDEYYRLNFRVRPEHLNPAQSGFSFVSGGHGTDEAQQRLDDFAALVKSADALAASLPANLQDAYYELVLYPVRCSALMNQKVLDAERSRLYAVQGRASTAKLAGAAKDAFEAIQTETAHYNSGALANGKWIRMMSAHPHPTKDNVFEMPTVGKCIPSADAGLGVAVEGSLQVLGEGAVGVLPTSNPTPEERRAFIDVFNTGETPLKWIARADAPWITLSQTEGNGDARVLVGVDRAKLPSASEAHSMVIIHGAGAERSVRVTSSASSVPNVPQSPVSWEIQGHVHIGAEAHRPVPADEQGGTYGIIKRGAPPHEDLMLVPPTTASLEPPRSFAGDGAVLQYDFYAFDAGPVTIRTACLPTHRINAEHPGVRYAVALNDEPPQVVDLDANEYTPAWNVNVLRGAAIGTTHHAIARPGLQTLKVQLLDPGVVLDRFDLQVGYRPGGEFEAEDLPAVSSSGRIYRTFADAPSSGGSAVAYESAKEGDFYTVALPDLQVGTYEVAVRAKGLDNRAKVRLSASDDLNGTYTDFGHEMDLYTPGPAYPEFTGNPLTVSKPGTQYLRFRVSGRNPANTSGLAWISVDRLTLTPVAAPGEAAR